MAEPIGPGDLVETTHDSFNFDLPKGTILTVKGVFPPNSYGCECSDPEPHGGLTIWEYPDPPYDGGYCIHSFRPISRRSSFERLLEQLKQPAPPVRQREPETV